MSQILKFQILFLQCGAKSFLYDALPTTTAISSSEFNTVAGLYVTNSSWQSIYTGYVTSYNTNMSDGTVLTSLNALQSTKKSKCSFTTGYFMMGLQAYIMTNCPNGLTNSIKTYCNSLSTWLTDCPFPVIQWVIQLQIKTKWKRSLKKFYLFFLVWLISNSLAIKIRTSISFKLTFLIQQKIPICELSLLFEGIFLIQKLTFTKNSEMTFLSIFYWNYATLLNSNLNYST